MLPFKIDLNNHVQHDENEADILERIQMKIDCEKVRRTTLELTLAQLLHEQRALLFSLPNPSTMGSADSEGVPASRSYSVGCTSPSSSAQQQASSQASTARRERSLSAPEPLTMSPNTRRRLDKDQVKLKKKRKQISNKLINLDYMLKQRSQERRHRPTSKRPRPSTVFPSSWSGPNTSLVADLKVETTHSSTNLFDQEDQCPSVGSTSPRDDCTCSAPSPVSPAQIQSPTAADSATLRPYLTPPSNEPSYPLVTPSATDLDSFVASDLSSPLLDDTLDLAFLESLMKTDEEHNNSLCNPDFATVLSMNEDIAAAAAQDAFASSFFLASPLLY